MCVEAAVEGIVVFSLAGGAHGEVGHGGEGAVVGDVFDDGVTRAAVGAVGERVAVAPVGRVEDFGQTVGADADVGGDEGVGAGLGLAVDDGEVGCAVGGNFGGGDGFDVGEGRRFVAQGGLEIARVARLCLRVR